jgi:hypothetical protein
MQDTNKKIFRRSNYQRCKQSIGTLTLKFPLIQMASIRTKKKTLMNCNYENPSIKRRLTHQLQRFQKTICSTLAKCDTAQK